jgi:NitT/TauT family transport system substrate-binding protein
VSLAHQVYMAKEVAKLVVPAGFDARMIGFIDPKAFQQTADFALKYGLLTKPAAVAASYDDSYWKMAVGK